MTTPPTPAIAPAPVHRPTDGKLDLRLCWWVFPAFYTAFGIIFVPLTHIMPPPRPGVSTAQAVAFFHHHRLGIQVGFVILLAIIGGAALTTGLITYQMKRMSVSPVFAYTYLGSLAVGGIPGCLFAAFAFLTATLRPDRSPHLIALLYDVGLLSFVGSLGCFIANYACFAIAVLLDRNRIFPQWVAYVSIWQIVTELLAAPVWVFHKGAFAWNGAISFYEGTVLFGVFITCVILYSRRAIASQDPVAAVVD